MHFLYPGFLFALSLLAIPVIIHLFNFRRYKKIYFTNVKFLTDLQQEQKSRNKLRHLLLLLLRMLALACLVLAFAHPFFPKKNALSNPGKKYVSIYIDNSFSMNAMNAEGELLQAAKKHALEIASGYKEGDGFNLVTNDFEVKHQRWVNRSEFTKLVGDVNASPAFEKVSAIRDRMDENFRKAGTGNKEAYIISDFQENMADLSSLKRDSGIHCNYVSLQASARNNVYIDSVWFESPLWQLNQKNTLYARIVNSGGENIADHTINLTINGKAKGLANFSIPAQGNTTVSLVFTITEDGENKGTLSLDDYPITFDNTFYFAYRVTRTVPVLVINGNQPNNNINIALGQEKSFVPTNVQAGSVDYSTLDKYDFIILNELPEISSGLAGSLKTYMQKSGNVLVLPASKDINLESYNSFMGLAGAGNIGSAIHTGTGVNDIDKKLPFYANIYEDMPRNVSMPQVQQYYDIKKTGTSRMQDLLTLNNGSPLLFMTAEGKGYLFISAIPYLEDWSSYTRHWLFLPALYKMAFYHNKEEPLYYTIDKDNMIDVPSLSGDEKKIYSLAKDSTEFIPNQKMQEGNLQMYVEGLVRNAGFYQLKDNQHSANISGTQYVFAFNYNRKESDMKFNAPSDIKTLVASTDATVINPGNISLKKQVKEMEEGINIWKWFIWGALVFLLSETLITRLWK